jgi:streptogramin lyase
MIRIGMMLDGAVWFTAQSAGKLGRLDPRTGKSDLIALGPGTAPHGVIVGPDGAAWVTEGGQNAIARVDPATRAVKLFPLALSRESVSSEGDGQVTMSHGSAFVSAPSLSGRDHSARDMALCPLHLELPRR